MSLEDRLDRGNAPAWRPDKDDPDKLVGEVVEIAVGTGDYDPYPILVIKTKDGEEKAVHAFHSVLKNQILGKRPQIGEEIGIKYRGETKPKSGGNAYINYDVVIDRQGSTFNWAAFGAPEEGPTEDVYTAVAEPVAEPVTVPAGAGDDDIPF